MDAVSASGLAGMSYGFAKASESSSRVVAAFTPPGTDGGVQAITDLQAAQRQVEASAAVLKTQQEMDKTLLDIVA